MMRIDQRKTRGHERIHRSKDKTPKKIKVVHIRLNLNKRKIRNYSK